MTANGQNRPIRTATLVPAPKELVQVSVWAEVNPERETSNKREEAKKVRSFIKLVCCGLLTAMSLQPALSQRAGGGDGGGQRMQGGGINYAPQPAIYSVISVDSYARTVRLRAADGRMGDVYVAEGIYDLSKLKAGVKIRVDFVVPDAANSKLSAASVWPVK